jgi:hypothetical protein
MVVTFLLASNEVQRNTAMGWAQTGLAVGLICGAPFGGALYGLTGKKELPFFVLAGEKFIFLLRGA